jgi:hypothetical protein
MQARQYERQAWQLERIAVHCAPWERIEVEAKLLEVRARLNLTQFRLTMAAGDAPVSPGLVHLEPS